MKLVGGGSVISGATPSSLCILQGYIESKQPGSETVSGPGAGIY